MSRCFPRIPVEAAGTKGGLAVLQSPVLPTPPLGLRTFKGPESCISGGSLDAGGNTMPCSALPSLSRWRKTIPSRCRWGLRGSEKGPAGDLWQAQC